MDCNGDIIKINEETERVLRAKLAAGKRVQLTPIDPDELPVVREMTRAGRREWSRAKRKAMRKALRAAGGQA